MRIHQPEDDMSASLPIPENPQPIEQVPYQKWGHIQSIDTEVLNPGKNTGYSKVKFTTVHFKAQRLPPFPYLMTSVDAHGLRFTAILKADLDVPLEIEKHFPGAEIDLLIHNSDADFNHSEKNSLGYPVRGTVPLPEERESWMRKLWNNLTHAR